MIQKTQQQTWQRRHLTPDRYRPMRAVIQTACPRGARAPQARLRLVPADSSPRVLRVFEGRPAAPVVGPPFVA